MLRACLSLSRDCGDLCLRFGEGGILDVLAEAEAFSADDSDIGQSDEVQHRLQVGFMMFENRGRCRPSRRRRATRR